MTDLTLFAGDGYLLCGLQFRPTVEGIESPALRGDPFLGVGADPSGKVDDVTEVSAKIALVDRFMVCNPGGEARRFR